jgi:hypothetical protein
MAAAILGFCFGAVAGALWITRLDKGWVESVGTLAAAVVSALAAVAAITIATQDRRNVAHQAAQDRTQTLVLSEIDQTRERYRDMQDLLVSFDNYAGTRWTGTGEEGESDRPTWQTAAAEFAGRLRACTEPLPQTRQLMFAHIPPDDDQLDSWLEGYFQALGNVGDPEIEPPGVMVVRAELQTARNDLLDEISRLRQQL